MAAGDLTTTQAVKDYLGIRDLESDAILASLVTSSSAWAISRIGRPILSASYTEKRDGDGTTRLLLDRWPVSAVTSVTIDGAAIPARADVSASNTNPDGWILRDEGIDLAGYKFANGLRNVVVVYTAGYATVPTDLAQAVTEHVALRFRDRERVGLASANGGGESASYSNAGTLAYVEGVLASYRLPMVG